MKILNVGCGDETYGTHRVDIHPTSTTTHIFDVEKGIQFPENTFDEVYERNLLEHLRNVGYHLEEVYRVLKPGGHLLLITDYAGCSRYYTLKTHEGRYEKKHKDTSEDKHYSIFTKQHIQNHLSSVGFKNIRIELVDTNHITRFLDKLTRAKPRIMVKAEK